MKTLTWTQVLAAAGVTVQGWRSLMRRKQVSLAFGAAMSPERGRFLDLDAACIRAALDFAPGLGVDIAASMIRFYSDLVVAAIGQADDHPETPTFLFIFEHADFHGKGKPAYKMGFGLGSEFGDLAQVFATSRHPDRIFFLNVTSMLARIRANGKRAGFDLSERFFPDPDNPAFLEIMREAREARAALAQEAKKSDAAIMMAGETV
jgi:hypothetical protein